nr:HTH domain-containing protein [Haloterrigena turkmenica]
MGTLESEQLLPDHPPAVGRIIHTLLTAENRLSQRDLADQAGVSARTIRNYRNRLKAFALIQINETGYRLALSFQTLPNATIPLFQPSSKRIRRSSTPPMRFSSQSSRQRDTVIPTTHLAAYCSGHRTPSDYSIITELDRGCDSQLRSQQQDLSGITGRCK